MKGVPGLHLYANFDRSGFKNVGLQPQNFKNRNFWYKFAPMEKNLGSK